MASFLPSSIQKRLLRYALLRTGLLETEELDLESLDITLGRQNTVELRNVGLNTQKLASLLELPPEIRLEVAKVLRLRLNVPADLYNGSITAEAHGIECEVALQAGLDGQTEEERDTSTRSPRHRKTHRRIGRSPPHDPGGHIDDELPTTQDLARSFLMEEPREEIQTLEQRYQSRHRKIKESFADDTSNDGQLGTGNTPGLPGFLASFLQGIVDRFEFKIHDVTAKMSLDMEDSAISGGEGVKGKSQAMRTVTAVLQVESVDLGGVSTDNAIPTRRHLAVNNIRLSLEGLRPTDSFPAQLSSTIGGHAASVPSQPASVGEPDMVESIYAPRSTSPDTTSIPISMTAAQRSDVPTTLATDEIEPPDPFEIRAGEDNLTWNLRRNESSDAASDIWSDSDQAADLAASVTADQYLAGSPRINQRATSTRTATRSLRIDDTTTSTPRARIHASASELHRLPQRSHLPNATASFASAPVETSLAPPESPVVPTTDPLLHASTHADLAESRVYSESEGESMFMSAYSTAPNDTSHDPIDGPSEGEYGGSRASTEACSPTDSADTLPAIQETPIPPTDSSLPTDQSQFLEESPRDFGTRTPTGLTDDSIHASPSGTPARTSAMRSQIIAIDKIDIWITNDSSDNYADSEQDAPYLARPRKISMSASHAPHLPGAFSVYAEQSASVRFDDPNASSAQIGTAKNSSNSAVEILVGNVQLAIDISMLSEYLCIGKSIGALASKHEVSSTQETQETRPQGKSASVSVKARMIEISTVRSADEYWRLIDAMSSTVQAPPTLVAIKILNVEAALNPPDSSADWCLRLGKVGVTVGEHQLLSFSDQMQESKVSIYQGDADISIDATTSMAAVSSQKVTQMSLQTKQVNFSLSFDKIEETFSNFGGLSSLLELSSSIASETSARPSPQPSRKGVRFSDSPVLENKSRSETKINARIGGVAAVVSSRIASVKLTTSAIKAVARSEYIAAAIDNVQLLGPHVSNGPPVKPVEVVLNSLRFEYLFHPKDADLERLLSLLTPSKNKYENDDDILIDTLLRQRRKGAVVRLTLGTIRARIHDWTFVDKLQAFADDLSSLSAVTKYLPEDERPGLLTLIKIQEAQASVPVNPTFGDMKVTVHDVNVAQIGLPSLVAFSIGVVRAGQDGRSHLVHEFMPVSTSEDLPMIMARVIGDEVEPTLRLKFFNLCVEYSIPTFLALTELGQDIRTDQVIDLAASTVIDLTAVAEHNLISPSSLTSSSSKPAKKLSIDVLFHDCMIGLQPEGLSSKVVVVLNDAKVTTEAPPKDAIKATIELRKSTVHVADQVEQLPSNSDVVRIALPQRLSSTFEDMGYVSVCSIMTARVDLQITESLDKADKSVQVDVRNELFLLESCADSTQTLMKTLSALAPPMPPSKEEKFRVEPMTMDEMVSSFTGDAFEPPAGPPSTLFDMDTTEPAADDEDDLFDADMSESFYGGLDALEDPGDDLLIQGDARGDTAESLLEEDPFEIPDNPNTAKLNNRDLTKALNEQLTSNIEGGPIELKPFLLTDEQLDRLPGESTVLGAPYRWNTPRSARPALVDTQGRKPLPFKLRVREVHLIWNLYDGYDWRGTRQAISQAVEEVEHRAEERRMRRKTMAEPEDEESIIGDCLFNSIYIGVPANKDPNELRRIINRGIDDLASESESYATSGISKPTNLSGGSGQRARRRPRRLKLERSKAHKIAFEAKGVSADILVYPPGGEAQNSIDLRVRDFEIFDNLPTSTWRKFMTPWHKESADREMAKPFIHAEITTVRPIPSLAATELVLTITITPIRLHVDQDALDFMTRFFEFKPASAIASAPSDEPFLQRIEVHTVDLLLDYKPKRVDYAGLRSGRYTEFKNFFILDAAHITLKHAILYGIKGFDPLHDTLNDIWMPDIKANQLPGIISGLATVSPLVNLGTGFAEVIAVPIREYRKDGRVVRSIQKGAVHLMRNTTSEIARFGARVAVGTQNVLTGAETMLSPAQGARRNVQEGWTDVDGEEKEERAVSAYANQPLGVLSGLKSARRHLERDLLMTRDAIIAVQGEVMDSGSASAAAQAVVRHAPTILLRPVIGASKAVGQTLMGAGNQLDREHVRRLEDKYKQR
ncbi:hypothetical protein BDZ85DRAFT_117169 [Elsinoe ampelina]|uniref:Autophagy-related protein 2 n=1 Tax=Elsinoe ampelina TaxID=302913 RepID=A0A6A6FXI1_9PEZI|nr:hypothetical protein BDZ85DRAFT_117169 [Elsinoe ampelina]